MRLIERPLCHRDVLVLRYLVDHPNVTLTELQKTFPQYQATGLSLALRALRAHGIPIKRITLSRNQYMYSYGVNA